VNIVYSRRAISDLDRISDYVTRHNPVAAREIGTYIRQKIERLAVFL
jgi:plasmid stabilization system protein ParE